MLRLLSPHAEFGIVMLVILVARLMKRQHLSSGPESQQHRSSKNCNGSASEVRLKEAKRKQHSEITTSDWPWHRPTQNTMPIEH
jgi:hypothetical protein